jgi:PleD family two-component response regulator
MTAAEAYKIGEVIRRKVEQLQEGPARVTISAGVASLTPLVTMPASVLVEAADKALYAAKAAGRNCAVIAPQAAHRALVA